MNDTLAAGDLCRGAFSTAASLEFGFTMDWTFSDLYGILRQAGGTGVSAECGFTVDKAHLATEGLPG